jgi:hypothetical protein
VYSAGGLVEALRTAEVAVIQDGIGGVELVGRTLGGILVKAVGDIGSSRGDSCPSGSDAGDQPPGGNRLLGIVGLSSGSVVTWRRA